MNYCYVVFFSAIFVCPIIGDEGSGPIENLYEKISIEDNMDNWNPFKWKKLNVTVTTTLRNPWLAVIGDDEYMDDWNPFKPKQLIIPTTTTPGYPFLDAVDLVTNEYDGWNPFKTRRTYTTPDIENLWLEINNTVTNKHESWNPFKPKRSNTTPAVENPWLEINDIIKNKSDAWNPFRRKPLSFTMVTENPLVQSADGQGMEELIKVIKDPVYKRYDGLMKKRETKPGFHYMDLLTKAPSTVIHMLAPELLHGEFYKKKSYIKGTTPVYSRKYHYINVNDSIPVYEPNLDFKQMERSIKLTDYSTKFPVTQRNLFDYIEYTELSDLDYSNKMKSKHYKDNDYDKHVFKATTEKPKYHFAHDYRQPEIIGSYNKYYGVKKTVVPDANDVFTFKASASHLQPMVKAEKIHDVVDSIFSNNDKTSGDVVHDTHYSLREMLTEPKKNISMNNGNITPQLKENKFSTNERYKKLHDYNVYPTATAKKNRTRFAFNNNFYKPYESKYDEKSPKSTYLSKRNENIPPPKENKYYTNERYKKNQDYNIFPTSTAKKNGARYAVNNKFYKPYDSNYDEKSPISIYLSENNGNIPLPKENKFSTNKRYTKFQDYNVFPTSTAKKNGARYADNNKFYKPYDSKYDKNIPKSIYLSKNNDNIPLPKEKNFSTNERYKQFQVYNVFATSTTKNDKFYQPYDSKYDEKSPGSIYKIYSVTEVNNFYQKYDVHNDYFNDNFQNALKTPINLKGLNASVQQGNEFKSNKLSISEKVSDQSIKEFEKIAKKQQKLGLSIPLLTKPKWWQHMVSNFDKYNKDNSTYQQSE